MRALNDYLERYGTTAYYQDLFIPQKYLLIGPDSLVQLLLLDGTEQATVIPRESISYVESNAIDDFRSITIYDKSGNSTSISVSTNESSLILDALNQQAA